MLNKFSEELKDARIKKELSLQQIAARTRIDLKFLENLETGNFAFLPELYIKAFIREYAILVDLDETITLKKFNTAKRGKAYDQFGNSDDDNKKIKQEKEEIKSSKLPADTPSYTPVYEALESSNQQSELTSDHAKKKKLLIGMAVGISVIFVIIYFAFIKESSDIIVSEKSYEQVQKDNEQRFTTGTQKPVAGDSNYMAKSDSLSLILESNDVSWIKILIDGTKSEEFTLFSNSYKEVKGLKNFRMTIGNAAAIKIKLNNKLLNFNGNKNEVKYVSIDSTGLQYLTSSPNP
jgi:transcriptional regulator with XRE-family HTH domain